MWHFVVGFLLLTLFLLFGFYLPPPPVAYEPPEAPAAGAVELELMPPYLPPRAVDVQWYYSHHPVCRNT